MLAKSAQTSSQSASLAAAPALTADMPQPQTSGVLGMTRTMGMSLPSMEASLLVATPAAIETTSVEASMPASTSDAATSGTLAGFTARMMQRAGMPDAASATVRTPRSRSISVRFSRPGFATVSMSADMPSMCRMPWAIARPMRPPPTISTDFSSLAMVFRIMP